jgi:hypothetical protein
VKNCAKNLSFNYKSAALNQLSYAGIYYINQSNKVRVIDGLLIAQAGENESQKKRY